MKYLIQIIILWLLGSLAHADVQNSQGFVAVDPLFQSQNAAVLITGEAAAQLYLLLQVEEEITKVKTAKNIRCRRSLNYGRDATEKFQCELTISPTGEVTAGF